MTLVGKNGNVGRDDYIDWAACGTAKQAKKHRDNGERPCRECLMAETHAAEDRRNARDGVVV